MAPRPPDRITVDGVVFEEQPDGSYKAVEGFTGQETPTLTKEQAEAIKAKQAAEEPGTADETEEPGKEFDKKKLAWLALPAALIIGGIVYHLMKDGQTYTPDEGRKNEDPTAEEKAASDKLLGENKDEVIAQGGQLAEGGDAAATDRGIAAETGSNAAARGLAALAVVAMVAAGAFAASRKLFA